MPGNLAEPLRPHPQRPRKIRQRSERRESRQLGSARIIFRRLVLDVHGETPELSLYANLMHILAAARHSNNPYADRHRAIDGQAQGGRDVGGGREGPRSLFRGSFKDDRLLVERIERNIVVDNVFGPS